MNKKYPLWYQIGAEFIKNAKIAAIVAFILFVTIMIVIGVINLFATGHLILGIISAVIFFICFIASVTTFGRFC